MMPADQGSVSIRVRIVGSSVVSNSVTYGYVVPCVSYIGGAGVVNGSTEGGDVVMLYGSDFGPIGTPVDYVVYGRGVVVGSNPLTVSTVVYYGHGCAVFVSHSVIRCVTAPGVGSGLVWAFSVFGQRGSLCAGSSAANVTSSYAAPVITSAVVVSSPDAPSGLLQTEGGSTVLVTGFNFGPVGNATLFFDGDVVSTLVQTDHRTAWFTSSPGSGVGKALQLVTGGLSSELNATLSYAAPNITGFGTLPGTCVLWDVLVVEAPMHECAVVVCDVSLLCLDVVC
jgi:hypothetical protein